jgi:hypothetical protein
VPLQPDLDLLDHQENPELLVSLEHLVRTVLLVHLACKVFLDLLDRRVPPELRVIVVNP